MNRSSVAIRLVGLITYFWFFNIFSMSSMAFIYVELASTSLLETSKPRNLPESTPKVHFSRFSFVLYFLRTLKISSR